MSKVLDIMLYAVSLEAYKKDEYDPQKTQQKIEDELQKKFPTQSPEEIKEHSKELVEYISHKREQVYTKTINAIDAEDAIKRKFKHSDHKLTEKKQLSSFEKIIRESLEWYKDGEQHQFVESLRSKEGAQAFYKESTDHLLKQFKSNPDIFPGASDKDLEKAASYTAKEIIKHNINESAKSNIDDRSSDNTKQNVAQKIFNKIKDKVTYAVKYIKANSAKRQTMRMMQSLQKKHRANDINSNRSNNVHKTSKATSVERI